MEDKSKSLISSNCQSKNENWDGDNLLMTWGFQLEELFKLSLKFFKDNKGKIFHPSYNEINYLLALIQQAKHGPFKSDKCPPLGPFDLIGRDRRQAWSDLGSISREKSSALFIEKLNNCCASFKPYIEAHKREKEEREKEEEEKRRKEEEEKEKEKLKNELVFTQNNIEIDEVNRNFDEMNDRKMAIRKALNSQTYLQFASYAAQQYPNDKELQIQLITRLQEQHFQQYMQQLSQYELALRSKNSEVETHCETDTSNETNNQVMSEDSNEDDNKDDNWNENVYLGQIENAQMWTKDDIKVFKDGIKKENRDCIIRVGHGEIVTVRVPTHPDGTSLFWEFATDSYDLGFGLIFEWTRNPGNQVSVHISESEDEEDDGDDDTPDSTNEDTEKGTNKKEEVPSAVIVPICRLDSHEKVCTGSHRYPGRGLYLLKFDNSYSLWRSKTLYYRVYYTK